MVKERWLYQLRYIKEEKRRKAYHYLNAFGLTP